MGHNNNEHWEVEHDIKVKKVKEDDGSAFIQFLFILFLIGLLFSGISG